MPCSESKTQARSALQQVMCFTLPNAQLLSLALTTFLYGASTKRLDLCSAIPQTDVPTDRTVLYITLHHRVDHVSPCECDGVYSSTAREDPSHVVPHVSGGDHGASITAEDSEPAHPANSLSI